MFIPNQANQGDSFCKSSYTPQKVQKQTKKGPKSLKTDSTAFYWPLLSQSPFYIYTAKSSSGTANGFLGGRAALRAYQPAP